MRQGLAVVGLLVALGLGFAVRWTPAERVADLRPRPDALEYEEAARNLVAGEGYGLVLDGGRYPPRYPPGFSLLLVPAVWATGGELGGGIWAVLVCALAGIAAVWTLGYLTGGPASAVAAAALLALAPLHVRWSRAVMADVPAATWMTLVSLGGVWCAARARGARAWSLLGVAVGLGGLLRSTCVLAALPLVAACVVEGGGRGAVSRRIAWFSLGVGTGLVPIALYDVVRFGSPWDSGYAYWVIADYFDWRYVLGAPVGGGSTGNLGFYLAQLAGFGALFSPWVAAAIVAGAVVGLRRAGPARFVVVVTLGTALLLSVTYVPFFWQWDRFLLPVLPLCVVVAALGVGERSPRRLRLASAALIAITVTNASRTSQAFAPPDLPLGEVAALRAIAASVEPNAVVVAEAEPLLVPRLLRGDTDRQWIALAPSEHQQVVRTFRRRPYGTAAPTAWIHQLPEPPADVEALTALVARMLAQGRPVYFAVVRLPVSERVSRQGAALAARFGFWPAAPGLPVELRRVGG
jgi:hypothetical protein